ncbi:MAG: hypothetical protein MUC88_00305 [Planctomycetes bacterium]|jgi:hypothetical protein|nr:hypothetical protein [Planctomycetota bacterium]
MTWLKDDINHRDHFKFQEAGFWAANVVETIWRLSMRHSPETGDVTRMWKPHIIARAALWPPEHMEQLPPAMERAIEVGLIDRTEDGRLLVHDWMDHQTRIPSSAERVRRHRAAKKNLPSALPSRGDQIREDKIRGEERRGEGNVTESYTVALHPVTETDCNVTSASPPRAHTHLFLSSFNNLLGIAGEPEALDLTTSDAGIERLAARRKTDLLSSATYAQEVARWAIMSSPRWKDGGHWSEVVTGAARFWEFFDKIERQFKRQKSGNSNGVHKVETTKEMIEAIERKAIRL